jgi:hypothetical protein
MAIPLLHLKENWSIFSYLCTSFNRRSQMKTAVDSRLTTNSYDFS